MKRSAVFLGLALVALCLLGVSSAADTRHAGSLDPSFGSGGIVTQSSGIEAIAVQPDRKIVVAGGNGGFALGRYLPDGSPDPSFGDAGHVFTSFAASAAAVALQPDGKIVVAGDRVIPATSNVSEFALARYNPNGSPDTSFGSDGIITTFIPVQGSPARARVTALAILPGGEILAGGTAGWDNDSITPATSLFALARYEPDGSLNTAFGDGGIVQTSFDGNLALDGMAVLPDGKIVAAGGAYGFGHGDDTTRMVIVRYAPDGSLDSTFGNLGKVATRAVLNYEGEQATFQAGKIVLAGVTRNGFPVLARYTAGGRLDSTFGKQGFVKIARLHGGSTAVLAQSDGKILFGANGGEDLVRLRPNGQLDPSFGTGGILHPLGSGLSALALQPDGKVLVGGGGSEPTIARLIGGNNCAVPDLRGETLSRARATLKSAYCRSGRISRRFSNRVARGRVIATAPQRGARLPGGARVELVVSRGKP